MKYFIIILTTTLYACGGGSSSTGDNSSVSDRPTLVSMSFDPLSGPDNVIAIDPAIDDGTFSVEWEYEYALPYSFKLYLSDDTQFDESDLHFYTLVCESSSTLINCNESNTTTCNFDNDNTFSCSTDDEDQGTQTNATSFFSEIPYQGNLLIGTCYGINNECLLNSQAITIN